MLEGRWKPRIQLRLPAKMAGNCNTRSWINRPSKMWLHRFCLDKKKLNLFTWFGAEFLGHCCRKTSQSIICPAGLTVSSSSLSVHDIRGCNPFPSPLRPRKFCRVLRPCDTTEPEMSGSQEGLPEIFRGGFEPLMVKKSKIFWWGHTRYRTHTTGWFICSENWVGLTSVVVAGFVLFKPIRFFKNKEQKGEFLSLKKNILSLVSA